MKLEIISHSLDLNLSPAEDMLHINKPRTTIPKSFFIFSDQHQDKYEYNQTNYRNKEMLHIVILLRSLKVF